MRKLEVAKRCNDLLKARPRTGTEDQTLWEYRWGRVVRPKHRQAHTETSIRVPFRHSRGKAVFVEPPKYLLSPLIV